MEASRGSPRSRILPRIVRKLRTSLRPAVFAFRRLWVHLSQPGVLVGAGTCLSRGVEFKVTDGGSIVIGPNCSILRRAILTRWGPPAS